MRTNVGVTDRALRNIIGVLLVAYAIAVRLPHGVESDRLDSHGGLRDLSAP
jgi:hypothetical protein